MSRSPVFSVRPLLACVPLLVAAAASAQTSTAPLSNAQLLQQLDPDMASVVFLFDAIKGTPIVDLSPQDARQQFAPQDAAKILARGFGKASAQTPVGKVTDGLYVTGRAGNQIPIRIYTPTGTGPFPVVTYYHGGGFVLATIDTYDASARALCNDAKAIVVSVEYRKAPEAPFPAAYNDAIDAYKWVVANIGTYNGIPSEVAVAGESAGGNLATEVALAARDGGFQMPVSEVLVYPETSSNLAQTSDLLYTSSALPLSTPEISYLDPLYVPDASQRSNAEVAPINAKLQGLPPTTIIAAQIDPLESDGMAYAAALKAAKVPVTYQLYTGVTHEFFGMGAVVAKAAQAEQFAAQQLDASF